VIEVHDCIIVYVCTNYFPLAVTQTDVVVGQTCDL